VKSESPFAHCGLKARYTMSDVDRWIIAYTCLCIVTVIFFSSSTKIIDFNSITQY